MTTFTTEEMEVLKELCRRLKFAFFNSLYVEGHPMFTDPKKGRRFLRKLGIHVAEKEGLE